MCMQGLFTLTREIGNWGEPEQVLPAQAHPNYRFPCMHVFLVLHWREFFCTQKVQ